MTEAQVRHGDCLELIPTIQGDSIDAVVTDPPYNLGFMGKVWDGGGVAFDPATWAAVLRVLKPGGHMLVFGGTRTHHRMACAIEDAGFEVRDTLMWLYGTGFPKSLDVSKAINKAVGVGRLTPTEAAACSGWGTALKPAFEPIVLARKPLSEGTVAANVLRWRTGALNINGCRVDVTATAESNALGRWPANVVHDGSEEVVGAFPQTSSGALLPGHGSGNAFGVANSNKRPRAIASIYGGDSGSAARFFYSAKASKADRAGSKHPTVKPINLMRWLARLVTPPGGTVLDPFAGSGTTGAAALAEGFKAILIEREAEYATDIRRRLSRRRAQ